MAAFTTIAAGVGMATSLGGGLMSFGQSAKAAAKAADAQRRTEELMIEARNRAQKNVYEKLKVPLDAFTEQYRRSQQATTQGIEALQGADARTLAAGIGAVSAQQQAADEQTRIQKAQALFELDKDKATAEENIKQQLIAMDVGAAKDQAKIQADQEKAQVAALQQGVGQIGKAGVQAAAFGTGLFGDEDLTTEELDFLKTYLEGSS